MTPELKVIIKAMLDTPQTQAAHALCLSLTPNEIPPYADWLEQMVDTADVTVEYDKDIPEVDYHAAVLAEVKAYIVVKVDYALLNY